MLWLAGSTRWVEAGAHIGFHAAYYVAKDCSGPCSLQVTPGGNAVVGAYLRELRVSDWHHPLPYRNCAHTQMEWLTAEKAEKYNIAMSFVK